MDAAVLDAYLMTGCKQSRSVFEKRVHVHSRQKHFAKPILMLVLALSPIRTFIYAVIQVHESPSVVAS